MQYSWIKDLIKLNKKDIEIKEEAWKELKEVTGMTDGQLKYTVIMLLDAMSNKYMSEAVKVKQSEEELKVRNEALDKINGRQRQMDLVSSGEGIAYKDWASVLKVKALLDEGKSKVEIAKILGISRNTVYRRIEELKNLEGDINEIRRII